MTRLALESQNPELKVDRIIFVDELQLELELDQMHA